MFNDKINFNQEIKFICAGVCKVYGDWLFIDRLCTVDLTPETAILSLISGLCNVCAGGFSDFSGLPFQSLLCEGLTPRQI